MSSYEQESHILAETGNSMSCLNCTYQGGSNKPEPDFEIPKFGNGEDIELKQVVADGGIIVTIEQLQVC